ncbi:MAG: tRNA lysidine(34) synthetase TilS [Bacteroidales bacterium]|jgi:tRNA(Ile)-lysidine synthase|nr:tRNA lysidine(34) synthetase TilS [Bacteroidales bacterium]
MNNRFIEYLTGKCRTGADKKYLLAVSGGIDSMTMASLFRKAGIDAGIAHCNFSLRGNESDLDEELVKQYAAENNMPFLHIRFDTGKYAAAQGISIQMAARNLRYEWFEKTRINHEYHYIATAHNLNDNVETLLLNLVRGTGIKGLTGIQPAAGYIVRPLLFALRSEIESHAMENGIVFREDRSNSETKYTRNKIRHLVLPLLREINPSVEKTLDETIERMQETGQAVESHVAAIRGKVSETEGNRTVFNIDGLERLQPNKTILYELFKPFGLSGTQAGELSEIIAGQTGKRIITKSHTILKDRERIVVSPNSNNTVYEVINSYRELEKTSLFNSVATVLVTDNFKIPADSIIACLDEDEIKYPLTVRNWRDGDYFYPLGMNSKKKVSDFLTDNHIPRTDKDRLLVLESDSKIAWVIGYRIDNRFRIKPQTRKALIINGGGW